MFLLSLTNIQQPIYSVCYQKQLEVVEHITKFTGQFIHNLMNIPGNTAFLRLITFTFYKYAITNQKVRDIPRFTICN